MTQSKNRFETIVGKGENAGNQHFLLFPQCFQHYQRQISSFLLIYFAAYKCINFGQV